MEQKRYLSRFIKIYPYLKGVTDDLLFFVAIDTLFYTVAKGLSEEQIVLLTTVSSFFSIIFRMLFVKIIRKIGNTASVRLGMGLLLSSAIIITFGPSYLWIMLGKIIYEVAFVFKDMECVMLKNNLGVLKEPNQYAKISNKGMNVYAFLTLIIALASGFLFNISPYLPMYLCITVCAVSFIIYFNMKDISSNNIITAKKNKKVKFTMLICIILISYAIFYGVVTSGQENTKLLMQYELSGIYQTAKVSMYLGIIVAASRASRLLGNMFFGKIYYKIKDKSLIFLTSMLFISFIFIIMGYFIPGNILKFILMSIGFCIILAVRDPFRLYTDDTILKLSKPEDQQVLISYVQFARKVGTTICSLFASALLLKWEMIHVIIGIGALALLEVFIAMKLYSMLESIGDNNKVDKNNKSDEGEITNDTICN